MRNVIFFSKYYFKLEIFFNTNVKILLYVIIHATTSLLKYFPVKPMPINNTVDIYTLRPNNMGMAEACI